MKLNEEQRSNIGLVIETVTEMHDRYLKDSLHVAGGIDEYGKLELTVYDTALGLFRRVYGSDRIKVTEWDSMQDAITATEAFCQDFRADQRRRMQGQLEELQRRIDQLGPKKEEAA